jgi:hypothetical protein
MLAFAKHDVDNIFDLFGCCSPSTTKWQCMPQLQLTSANVKRKVPQEDLLVQQCRQQGYFAKATLLTLNINAACHLHCFFIVSPRNSKLIVTPFSWHLNKNGIFCAPLQQPILVSHKLSDKFDGIAKKNIMLILAGCHGDRFQNIALA